MPPTLNVTTISVNEVLLEWNIPFTWPDHGILTYNIREVASYNVSNQFYSAVLLENQQMECKPVTFTVAAVSDLGWSQPATAVTGLPIG